jgi:cytochrome c-type protein NapB
MSHHLQIAALAVAALASCTGARPAPSAPAAAASVKDRDLGLSRISVFEVPSPSLFKAEASSPGETPLPPRVSSQIPPVVPHTLADLPVRLEQNACVDCHQVDGPKKPGEATPIPASHYVDLRNAPDQKGEKVAGARWICTACHVGRTDAPPLVGSGFRP